MQVLQKTEKIINILKLIAERAIERYKRAAFFATKAWMTNMLIDIQRQMI